MEEFIFVIEKDTEKRVILPISKIVSIVEAENEETFFETKVLDDLSSTGILTTAKFDDIMSMLANKILVK